MRCGLLCRAVPCCVRHTQLDVWAKRIQLLYADMTEECVTAGDYDDLLSNGHLMDVTNCTLQGVCVCMHVVHVGGMCYARICRMCHKVVAAAMLVDGEVLLLQASWVGGHQQQGINAELGSNPQLMTQATAH